MIKRVDRSNARGTVFEEVVASLLELLRLRHPEVVEIGTFAIPDFELVCKLPHQVDCRIIECQSRERSSQDIVHKIRDMKSMSSKNRFVFVFQDSDYLSKSVRRALEADGIVYYSIVDFAAFVVRLDGVLMSVFSFPDTRARLNLLTEISEVLYRTLGVKVVELERSLIGSPAQPDRL